MLCCVGDYQIKYSWLVSSIAYGTISGVGAAPVVSEHQLSSVPVASSDRHGNNRVGVCKQHIGTRDDVMVVNHIDDTITRTCPHLAIARLQQTHLRFTSKKFNATEKRTEFSEHHLQNR